ncbi:hypothetical protein [Nannocystis pusilla]|uniref:hypothetical protein n=1 Tax=Nannocystis pusilla TaxID=889268 RepID=UPI003BF17940
MVHDIRNKLIALASTLSLTGLLATSVALAASVHFKGGPNAGPSFRDTGLALRASGALAGLGNEDLVIRLVATGDVTATCTNPSGTTQPPGQNPAEVVLTGFQPIPASEIKNGNVSFNVRTQAPDTPIPGAPDCPNSKWREDIQDVSFTSAVLTVEQPEGNVVLEVDCTFPGGTDDGAVVCG